MQAIRFSFFLNSSHRLYLNIYVTNYSALSNMASINELNKRTDTPFIEWILSSLRGFPKTEVEIAFLTLQQWPHYFDDVMVPKYKKGKQLQFKTVQNNAGKWKLKWYRLKKKKTVRYGFLDKKHEIIYSLLGNLDCIWNRASNIPDI